LIFHKKILKIFKDKRVYNKNTYTIKLGGRLMNTQNFNKCISDFLVKTILNCPEKCIAENEEGITISLPEDKLTQDLTEKIREHIYELLESQDFAIELSKEFSKEKDKNLECFILKDLDGFVIHFKNKNGA